MMNSMIKLRMKNSYILFGHKSGINRKINFNFNFNYFPQLTFPDLSFSEMTFSELCY